MEGNDENLLLIAGKKGGEEFSVNWQAE